MLRNALTPHALGAAGTCSRDGCDAGSAPEFSAASDNGYHVSDAARATDANRQMVGRAKVQSPGNLPADMGRPAVMISRSASARVNPMLLA